MGQKYSQLGGLSIRFKLLSLLIAMPATFLLLYLLLAIRLFESDKIAYVFDSGASLARTLSAQVSAELKIVANQIEAGSADIAPCVVRYSRILGNPSNGDAFKLESGSECGIPSMVGISIAKDACVNGIALLPWKPEALEAEPGKKTMTIASCPLRGAPTAVAYVARVEANAIVDSFQKSGAHSSYLVNAAGERVLGPSASGIELPQSFAQWEAFVRIRDSRAAEGASTSESIDHKKLLVSHSKLGVGEFWVIALVEKRVALKAIQALASKSALFFVLLVCVAAILSVLASRKLTATLQELVQATYRIAEGDFDIQVKTRTKDEAGLLARSFNRMGAEVRRLLQENIAKVRMEKELETAKHVQETLFPESDYVSSGLEVCGYYEPTSECGGDWWYYSKSGGFVYVWIGDATGHGAPAALITSAARSAAAILQRIPSLTPSAIMNLLNAAIYETSKGSLQMTFFLARIEEATGEVVYCNASHHPPFILRRSGEESTLEIVQSNIEPRLGERLEYSYSEQKMKMADEDLMLLYTDGASDLVRPDGRQLGERAFSRYLLAIDKEPASKVNRSARRLLDELTARLVAYRADAPLADDITVVAVARARNAKQAKQINLPEGTVFVGAGLAAPELLDQAISLRAQHFVQGSELEISREIESSKRILADPKRALSDPGWATLGENSASSIVSRRRFVLSSTEDKDRTLTEMTEWLGSLPGNGKANAPARQIADELLINAFFNAPVSSDQTHSNRTLPRSSAVHLKPGQEVELLIFVSQETIVIACADPFGSLDPDALILGIRACYVRGGKPLLADSQPGAGIGCYAIYDLSASMYLLVERSVRTVIAASLPRETTYRKIDSAVKSIHIATIG